MTKTEKTTGRMPNAALMKPVQPDDALAVIVGSTPLPRGELTSVSWSRGVIRAVIDTNVLVSSCRTVLNV